MIIKVITKFPYLYLASFPIASLIQLITGLKLKSGTSYT